MLAACDELAKLRKRFLQLKQRMVAVPRQSKPKQNRRLRWELARLAVQISRNACAIQLQNQAVKDLIFKLRAAVDEVRPIEQRIARNQRAIEAAGSGAGGSDAGIAPRAAPAGGGDAGTGGEVRFSRDRAAPLARTGEPLGPRGRDARARN